MQVYEPKQHLKQQTGLSYLTNFEMTHLKFSLTSQCHKKNFAYRVQEQKKLTAAWYRPTTSQCRLT